MNLEWPITTCNVVGTALLYIDNVNNNFNKLNIKCKSNNKSIYTYIHIDLVVYHYTPL